MWFGTKDGLNRFDGYTFKVYRHDPQDSQSPNHNHITSIYKDAEGILWIGTYGGGLDRFDPETGLWRHYQHDPTDPDSLSHIRTGMVFYGSQRTAAGSTSLTGRRGGSYITDPIPTILLL
jgi:streptogramin lyase